MRRAFDAELADIHREIAEVDQPLSHADVEDTDERTPAPERRNRRGPNPKP